jgi:hypothetical protein
LGCSSYLFRLMARNVVCTFQQSFCHFCLPLVHLNNAHPFLAGHDLYDYWCCIVAHSNSMPVVNDSSV